MKNALVAVLFGLLFIISAITGYVTFELRLHEEYQDYREHRYLECGYCHSLASSISSQYHYLEWTHKDKEEMSPWIRKLLISKDKEVIYDANPACRHLWERQVVGEKNFVFEMWPVCFMPFRFFQVQELKAYLIYILGCLILISLGHLFLMSKLHNKNRHVVFATVWGLMAGAVLIFCAAYPVGVPVTAFLREYRFLAKHHHEKTSDMKSRVQYMLSDEIFTEMDKYTENYIPNTFEPVWPTVPSEIRSMTFPFRQWKRAQARLAVATSQYDAEMAGKFFYGPGFACNNNLTNLTTCLVKQLVNMNDRPSFLNRDPIIKQVKIRGEGIVDVLWYQNDMPHYCFLTIYKAYNLKNDKIWIPIRNVCEGSFYTHEYGSIGKLITW